MIVPIFHTKRELGSFGQRISETTENAIQNYWAAITETIKGLPIDFSRLFVYQDSLPDLPTETVDDWLSTSPDTPNYGILKFLKEKGATLVGTENSKLLLDHINLIEDVMNISASEKTVNELYEEGSIGLLYARDRYIANRIGQTLTETGVGLLFLGKRHNVKDLLPEDIIVATTEDSLETLLTFLSEIREKTRQIPGKERQ